MPIPRTHARAYAAIAINRKIMRHLAELQLLNNQLKDLTNLPMSSQNRTNQMHLMRDMKRLNAIVDKLCVKRDTIIPPREEEEEEDETEEDPVIPPAVLSDAI